MSAIVGLQAAYEAVVVERNRHWDDLIVELPDEPVTEWERVWHRQGLVEGLVLAMSILERHGASVGLVGVEGVEEFRS